MMAEQWHGHFVNASKILDGLGSWPGHFKDGSFKLYKTKMGEYILKWAVMIMNYILPTQTRPNPLICQPYSHHAVDKRKVFHNLQKHDYAISFQMNRNLQES